MMFIIGLTGSIGMGKSSTAEVFRQLGCAVWDADAAVRRLYSKEGQAVAPMREDFPDAITNDTVDREKLKRIIADDQAALGKIESIVHPLVASDRANFLSNHQGEIVVLDIPLLFETGSADHMDAVVVVSTDAETQRQRVLDRGTMTEAQLKRILAKQLPDSEKRAKADFVVITDTPENAERQVQLILEKIRSTMDA
ncbi:MAG: dephospho-CoA kinase [Paracoccaceae bacterium]|nr:dephospho-CoA kinase [Paracoccaceae bacterium]